jgi:tetraacyldisaccharide 4'-kinase
MNPLSAIFGVGVAMRNALYDRGVLTIRKLTRPVVSVGNISVGGSGKTPFVIALGELLKQRGIAFDVLSRGYGRDSSDVAVVDPQGAPERFGDEPLLIARKLEVPVVVGADRYQAGLMAEAKFDVQLHLLDDGFQHRKLHRDFDIVILRAADIRDTLLPVGRLREPVSSGRRADALATLDHIVASSKPIWAGQRQITLASNPGTTIAFCGIARPDQFFFELKRSGARLKDIVSFPDHHRYSEKDVNRLLRLKAGHNADGFVTTEKDLINLGTLAGRLSSLQVVPLKVALLYPGDALSTMLSTLEQRCGCRFPPGHEKI